MVYEYYPFLVLRAPVFPLKDLLDDGPDFVSDARFREGLYLASPDLARMVDEEGVPLEGDLALSLLKYFNRMCSRCTPFGVFAGCSVVAWDKETNLSIDTNRINRKTRPDKAFLAALLAKLHESPAVLLGLSFRTNNTLYRLGGEYRMIERGDVPGDFNISAIGADPVLDDFVGMLGNDWINVQQLLAKGRLLGYSEREIYKYIRALWSNQVICSNLDMALNNNDLLEHWIKELSGKQDRDTRRCLNWLTRFKEQLGSLDSVDIFDPKALAALYSFVDEAGVDQPKNRVLQVDCTFQEPAGTLSYAVQRQLNKGIDILKKISVVNSEDPELTAFRSRFLKKYEQQEVPLLLALDPETGIDYLEGGTGFDNFLSREIALAATTGRAFVELNFNLKLILQKQEEALATGAQVIELTDDDIRRMEEQERLLPVTTSVFFRMTGGDSLQIESLSGSSGINLFTRFTHVDERLRRMARELTDLEQTISGDTILAELIHEPEPRAGNVLPHWPFRAFDISYFANSARPKEEQIALDDLLLSVRSGRFVLRSKRLKQLVKPMISSAYNYRKGSPIYRFLGALQLQGLDQLQFDFEKISPGKAFYPRLVYEKIVFSVARWKLDIADLGGNSVRELLAARGVPRLFVIAEGDNELLIDTEQDALLDLFADHFRKKRMLTIKELLLDDKDYPVVNASGQALNNQLIAILINKTSPSSVAFSVAGEAAAGVQRTFSLGSEWLYYKLYSGVISCDKILAQQVFKLLRSLKRDKLIDAAFFIRYQDPDPHIRLRLHLGAQGNLQAVITALRSVLLELENSGQLWKVQTDTYQRELERYGDAMLRSEKIFDLDSLAILRLLATPSVLEDPPSRLAAGIRLCRDLLDIFLIGIPAQLAFIGSVKALLKTDIGLDTEAAKVINRSYRAHAETYLRFLESAPPRLEKIFRARSKGIARVMPGPVPAHLLESHIHMSVNRLFAGHQKVYEYIIYDYLYRHLNSIRQRGAS